MIITFDKDIVILIKLLEFLKQRDFNTFAKKVVKIKI